MVGEIIGTREQGAAYMADMCINGPYQYGFLVQSIGGEGMIPVDIDEAAFRIGETCGDVNPHWEEDYELGRNVVMTQEFMQFFAMAYLRKGMAFAAALGLQVPAIPGLPK
jgi:hypothetical protein